MSDFADLMWSNAGRDLGEEQQERARTAALHDAQAAVWPLIAQASTEAEMGHRLALARHHLQAVADQRGYGREALEADLVRRWKILAEARAAAAPAAAASGVQEEDEEDGDPVRALAVARMAATAAAENPGLPFAACLELAEAAADRHLTVEAAYPLAYDNWSHVVNGPLMERLKSWKPKSVPSWLRGRSTPQAPAAAPAPSAPAAPAAPAASPVPKPSEHPVGQVPHLDLSDLTHQVNQTAQDSMETRLPGEQHREHQYTLMNGRTDRAHEQLDQHRQQHGLTGEQSFDDRNSDMEARLDRLQHSLGSPAPEAAAPAAAPAARTPGPRRNAPHPGQEPLPGMGHMGSLAAGDDDSLLDFLL